MTRQESFACFLLIVLYWMTALAVSVPVLSKVLLFTLTALALVGCLAGIETLVNLSCGSAYLLLVASAAQAANHLLSLLLLGVLLLALWDALHILMRGKLAGASFIARWYLPTYLSSAVVVLIWTQLRSTIPQVPATLVVASVAVVLYAATHLLRE